MKYDTKTKKLTYSEKEIRSQVKDFLKQAVKCWWWNAQSALAYHGLPDYEGIYNGRHFYIEVKSSRGKLSGNQEKFKEMVEKEGEKVFVVNDASIFVKEWNLWVGWDKN
jgi:hypothetical protein